MSAPKMGSPKRRAIFDFGPMYFAIIKIKKCYFVVGMPLGSLVEPLGFRALHAAAFWWAAAVVWEWCDVDNLDDLDTGTVDGTDS